MRKIINKRMLNAFNKPTLSRSRQLAISAH